MKNDKWLDEYFNLYRESIFQPRIYKDLFAIKELWANAAQNGRKIIFAGNGGSAAMASHCAVDLTKNAGLRAINFNEADLITCLGNDFGYDLWMAKAVEFYGDSGDVLVLISSSGRSRNVIAAAEQARKMEIQVVTFSGFETDNPLRREGSINLWVDCNAYNIVEMTHHIWLLSIIDLIVGSAEYPA